MTRSDVTKGHPEYYQDLAADIARRTPGAFYINQFANPANPRAHEESTAPEIWAQMDHDVDAVVAASAPAARSPASRVSSRRPRRTTDIVLADPQGSILASYIETGKVASRRGLVARGGDRRGLHPAGVRPVAGEEGLHRSRTREAFDVLRTLLQEGRHHGRHLVRHADRRGAALLPRADAAQARGHAGVRQRQQVPVQGLQRLLDARPGLHQARDARRPARPHLAAPQGARRGDGRRRRDGERGLPAHEALRRLAAAGAEGRQDRRHRHRGGHPARGLRQSRAFPRAGRRRRWKRTSSRCRRARRSRS